MRQKKWQKEKRGRGQNEGIEKTTEEEMKEDGL